MGGELEGEDAVWSVSEIGGDSVDGDSGGEDAV